jgi:hypothetical protein
MWGCAAFGLLNNIRFGYGKHGGSLAFIARLGREQ